jgi:tRNA pseudouridine55 synthase
MKMFGILNVNKPAGWTSRDAVNRVQKLVRPDKVGHAGTLDPLATGVLVVCVGQATRLIDYVHQADKEYTATFLLGRTSPSDDTETEVTELTDRHEPTRQEIESALPRFVGRIAQVPPAYSAVKIAGQRAYDLARRGQEIAIGARPVEIHEIEILAYDYPQLLLRIRCGSGTYIRSLGRDLAAALGTGAVMSALTRTRIGLFALADSLAITELALEQIQAALLPPLKAVGHLPHVVLDEESIHELRFGRTIPGDCHTDCAGVDEQGNLIAMLSPKQPGRLKPHINFARPV